PPGRHATNFGARIGPERSYENRDAIASGRILGAGVAGVVVPCLLVRLPRVRTGRVLARFSGGDSIGVDIGASGVRSAVVGRSQHGRVPARWRRAGWLRGSPW